jgi:site-specific recombinase XerC
VTEWLENQNKKNTRRIFKVCFKKFWEWIESEGLFDSPETMLRDYEQRTGKQQYEHVRIIKRFMRWLRDEKEWSTNARKTMLTCIRSFYAYNGTPLPKIQKSDLSAMLESTEKEKREYLERKPVPIEDLKATLMEAEEPYRTIFQIMLQSGMGLAEFQYFNRYGWKQIKDQLDKPGPMKINLFRVKTSGEKLEKYYTFIGEEGKEAIKRWLRIREQKYGPVKDEEPIFITIKKMNGEIAPPASVTIHAQMVKAMKRAGVVPRTQKGRYDLHPHELRDIFKSMCTIAGVKEVASEFFLGHRIDRLGYDKSPEYAVEFFKNEYLKVEPKLSLWTRNARLIEVERRIRELEEENRRLKERLNGLTEAYKEESKELIKTKEILYSKEEINEYIENRARELFEEFLKTLDVKSAEKIVEMAKRKQQV